MAGGGYLAELTPDELKVSALVPLPDTAPHEPEAVEVLLGCSNRVFDCCHDRAEKSKIMSKARGGQEKSETRNAIKFRTAREGTPPNTNGHLKSSRSLVDRALRLGVSGRPFNSDQSHTFCFYSDPDQPTSKVNQQRARNFLFGTTEKVCGPPGKSLWTRIDPPPRIALGVSLFS